MAKNLLVINVDHRETRVALIEEGIIVELHIERASTRGTLGDIYLGKVTRVLPGMQAAFIDIGLERAAFLHVEDLIRPDDFEAYLAGAKREDREAVPSANADADAAIAEQVPTASEAAAAAEADTDVEIETEPEAEAEADVEPSDEDSDEAEEADGDAAADEEAIDETADETADEAVDEAAEEAAEEAADEAEPIAAEPAVEAEPAVVAVASGAEPSAVVTAPSKPKEERIREARSGGRRRGRGREERGKRRRGRDRGGNDRERNHDRGGREPSRVSRSTPIRDVVREGQEVIVQVSKEPIGTKGARVTSHVSLPGRYVVYMPTVEHIGISKRIGSDKERSRLREAIEGMKPPTGGLIVRTVAEGLTKKQLKADVGYLVRLWAETGKKREGARSPALLYQELDIVLKTARDLFTDEIEQLVIDDREQYHRLVRFVEMFMPERVKDIVLYTGDEPIFDAYGIEDEISRALSRKVPLPSGGYLIIDQAEALTAIDVNTGRFVGKGSKDLEDTLLKTNLEAVEEIAYQLRFRNLGGLIVLDLIDMDRASSREKVRRRLEELLQKDKAKTTLNRISDLGLIEMTRKRTRESLGRLLHEPCFYCDGTGQLMSKQTIAYEILRQIRRDRGSLPGYSVIVNAHPAVIDLMKGEEREAVQDAERRFMRRIELVPRKEYHLEQFDLQGR